MNIVENRHHKLLLFSVIDEVNCPKKRNCTVEDKCTQHCILTIDNKPACACQPGYQLGKDNATCEDINECKFEQVRMSNKCSVYISIEIKSMFQNCLEGIFIDENLL